MILNSRVTQGQEGVLQQKLTSFDDVSLFLFSEEKLSEFLLTVCIIVYHIFFSQGCIKTNLASE